MLDCCLLGTGGMMPLHNRFLTSLLLRLDGKLLLVDCGEGTQITLKLASFGVKAISTICFTHYHADHISGLAGLLLTLGNAGRTEPVCLIGPIGLQKIVESILVIAPNLPFELVFKETDGFAEFDEGGLHISTAPMQHAIDCVGYRFDVRRKGKFSIEKAKANSVPLELWSALQKSNETCFEGKIYKSEMVLGEERAGISVCYATDTRPNDALTNLAQNADLFICEGIYGENEKLDKAIEYRHMLFSEAAQTAKNANAKELWLTHFSPSLPNPEDFLVNATSIFSNTVVGYDRIIKSISFTK